MLFPFLYFIGEKMVVPKLKKQHLAKITEISQVSKTLYYIKFMPDCKFESKAGQFVSILCPNHTLRRPFSIASLDNNEISVLFKKKGSGTEYISNLKVGDTIDFVGAMGNGFKFNINEKALLIGAGVGVAPVYYLKNEIDNAGGNSKLIAGFMSKEEIPSNMSFDEVSTNDGSAGLKGSIIDYLEQEINTYKPDVIYSCGPHVVLKIISEYAKKYGIPSYVALEKVMACSIGVCRGCVIKLQKNGKVVNASVCQDGPVFKGDEVIWQ